MVFTHKLMVSTVNAVKPADDQWSSSSKHSVDSDSGPWSACSSADMCTPMPHKTSHPINSKRYSNASDRSITTASHTSACVSEMGSMESHKPAQPLTPPTVSPAHMSASSDALESETPSDHRLFPEARSCFPGQLPALSVAQLTSFNGSSNYGPSHTAVNNRRFEPTACTPLRHKLAKPSLRYGSVEHNRSMSHYSATSSDSWNSFSPDNHGPELMYSGGLRAPFSQMNLHSSPLSATPSLSTARVASLKSMAAQASLEALYNQNSSNARILLDSLTPMSTEHMNAQMAFGATPLDTQNLMAYNATFASPTLMYLYGLSPEILAARSAALAQVVQSNATANSCTPSVESIEDEGPNPGNKKTNLYKTELCRSWEEKGTCRYGSKCQFAHGQEELKNVNRHPKFKTEICRTFWLHGSCPYGKRCCFLHTTSNEAGSLSARDTSDTDRATKATRNAHDPPTSRLQKRVSASLLSTATPATSPPGISSLSPHIPHPTRSVSDFSHSRSNSNSSCSQTSEGSSHIDSLRIQIWPRFGAREQVPAQDAPGPRSRLQRLRPTEDYSDSSNSVPSTSTHSTTRYSSFLDIHQPPHSAFSVSSMLARSPSQPIAKARSATGVAETHWPLSRLASGSSMA